MIDRALGCALGHAMGDAYGRPIEFVSGIAVRITPLRVKAGQFLWTDDTHMSLYVGQALRDCDRPLDEDELGHAVGRRFVEWLSDPRTPTSGPGGTCLRGARAYDEGRDWRRSGDPGSDGCGAVMRIWPVAVACEGEELAMAARVQALVTHAHDNAVNGAVVAAELLRRTLVEGRFDAALVTSVLPLAKGDVHVALSAALELSGRDDEWLDEAAVPPGDGGWRTPSALGLAVTAALRWGDDFETAIDRAARIDGDSDSVACLAGMFLGAAGGTAVLPEAWLDVLPEKDAIADLARALLQ